jgi:hypothetical protein
MPLQGKQRRDCQHSRPCTAAAAPQTACAVLRFCRAGQGGLRPLCEGGMQPSHPLGSSGATRPSPTSAARNLAGRGAMLHPLTLCACSAAQGLQSRCTGHRPGRSPMFHMRPHPLPPAPYPLPLSSSAPPRAEPGERRQLNHMCLPRSPRLRPCTQRHGNWQAAPARASGSRAAPCATKWWLGLCNRPLSLSNLSSTPFLAS